ncbi:neprilysin-2-like [Venturia canescens]|uniref:neprilysin-2-like n=1 Tax=Venturia canescens TaxID=32260 RepID=UPI001C9C4D56|nr:neprilysin-2-like [Venturia canescens]
MTQSIVVHDLLELFSRRSTILIDRCCSKISKSSKSLDTEQTRRIDRIVVARKSACTLLNYQFRKPLSSRKRKCWKPSALASWLTLVEVSTLLLCSISSPIAGRSTRDIPSSNVSDNSDSLCSTEDCLRSASTILENLDPSVEPCDDFYRYACGGFINKTILPENQEKLNSLLIGGLKVREQVKSMIEEDIEPDAPRHFKLMKDLYNICMNETAFKAAGFKPLLQQLEKFGGWPVLLGDAWNENEFNWVETIYKLRNSGNPFFQLIASGVVLDVKNNSRYVIAIDQATLGIPRDFLLNGTDDPEVQRHYEKMVKTAVQLGAQRARAEKEMMEALVFEMKLANITDPEEVRRNITLIYNPMSIRALSEAYPSVRWIEFFNRMVPSPTTVEEDEIIIVKSPKFFTELEKLLAETPKRTVANYLLWAPVWGSLDYLGLPPNTPNPEVCARDVITKFQILTSAMYVRRYFSKEAKRNAIEMVEDLMRQAIDMLEKNDWMDNTTKARALEKARTMTSYVGYPDELLDDHELEKYYEKLDISGDSYLDSILKIVHFDEDLSWSKLHQPVNRSEWTGHADSATVDAYAMYDQNSFVIPAGILQGFFFNINRPNYMNYGAIGYAIGHEITHNFDDVGRYFDKNGKFADWWVPSTEVRYQQRAQCLLDQYGNYTVPEIGVKLNAQRTQGENIGDNGGIKIAYMAYKSWVARNKPEARLPQIDRTPEQMFWLSAASVWCAKSTLDSLRNEVATDPHSPERFRVLGAFSNMPEFAADYHCPVGSNMNPEKKCSVW